MACTLHQFEGGFGVLWLASGVFDFPDVFCLQGPRRGL